MARWWVGALLGGLLMASAAVAATPTPTATPGVCPGDCNHDGVVVASELQTAQDIINGIQPLSACTAADVNADGQVRANEITIIINTLNNGPCGPRVGPQLLFQTPTATATPACACDCDSNGIVTTAEIDLATTLISTGPPYTLCPAADANGDGQVRANDITICINALNNGTCAEPNYLPGCVGDCNSDGFVEQSEIDLMTAIINGTRNFADCVNGDADGDGQIRASDVTQAINALNYGCLYEERARAYFTVPPPTSTVTPTVVATPYVPPVVIKHTRTPTPTLAIVISTQTPVFTATGTPTATATPTPTELVCRGYSDVVMDDDPRVYYLLDESAGATVAVDRMNRNNGTYETTSSLDYEQPGCCIGQSTPAPTPTPANPLFAHGCYTGDASDDRAITTGFRPSLVYVGEVTVAGGNNNTMVYRDRTFADGISAVLHTSLGNTTQVDAIQTFTDTGFEVGTSTYVNGNIRSYCWAAWQEGPDYHEVGQFTGNGVPNHQVMTGFVPDVAVVHPLTNIFNRVGDPWLHTQTMGTGDLSCVWANNSGIDCTTDGITALLSSPITGFAVGNGQPPFSMNPSGTEHHYAVWKEHANYLDFGSYVGTGAIPGNTKTITTDCPSVAAVFIRGATTANRCSVWRSSSMESPYVLSAGYSMGVGMPGGDSGGIRSLFGNTGTFTVEKGSSTPDFDCNENNVTFYWWAMCEQPSVTPTPTRTTTPTPTETLTPSSTPVSTFTTVCVSANNATSSGTGWTDTSGAASLITGYNTVGPSNVVKLTNLGFAIPNGSTITGIEVDMGGGAPKNGLTSSFLPVTTVCDSWTSLPRDTIVQLLDASGNPVGSNKATGASWPVSGNSLLFPDDYGGPTDLWGATWTATDINDTDFGVEIQVDWASSNDETDCDAYWTVEFADPNSEPAITAGQANVTVCYEGIAPTVTETPTETPTATPTPTGSGCSTYTFDTGFGCSTTYTTSSSGGTLDWGGDCSSAITADVTSGAAGTTYLLKITGGTLTAGSAVPGSATIDGVRLTSGMAFTHNSETCAPIMWDTPPQDNVVRLVNGSGTVVGTDKGNDATIVQGTIYGGLADDWSASLTGADFASATFGFAFQSTFDATTNTFDDCGGDRQIVFSNTTMEVCWHE